MKPGATRLPRAVIAGLFLAIVLDTFVQIAWKLSVSGARGDATPVGTVRAALASPLFFAAMLGLVAQLFNWMRVLARADLSFAQPFTALGYVSVLAISAISLNERIATPKIVGVGLILTGVFFISRTPFSTTPRGIQDPRRPNPVRP